MFIKAVDVLKYEEKKKGGVNFLSMKEKGNLKICFLSLVPVI